MAALIIGIDLGATTTVVSRINEVGEPQLVMNWDNAPFTDSAIWFPEDSPAQPIFGATARGMAGVQEGAFMEYKRDMGTERVYQAHGKQYTPTELSALMLRKQREHIENTYDQKIDSVVISVPANFLNEARAATITAAKDAGFPDPITTIDESTAAALFYAYKAPIALNGKYLMVHFDANTLDVTAFEAKDTQIEVKHSMGVSQLGDKSFNAATYDLVSQKFKEKTGSNIEGHAACFSVFDVEKVKHRLTEVEKHEIKIYSALHGGKVAVSVTRDEFEEQISALITQLQYCIEGVLEKTGISSSNLKGIFLAGVSGQIPAVRTCIQRISGIKPTQEIDNRAVAHGAALFAAHRLGIRKPQTLWPAIKPATSRMRIKEACPHYIGILERDWLTGKVRNRPIIMKGAHLPQSHEFLLSADSGGAFPEIIISQCAFETTDRDDVTVLAEFHGHSTNGKPYAKGLLILEVDGNAVFRGKFTETGTGKTTLFTMKNETDAPPPPDIDDFIV